MASVEAEFGEELRVERERRGLSLETLCARTKVKLRHLEALERGDYMALPGGVFRRGFVRAYLGSVGLEESDWLPRFEASYAAYLRAVGVPSELAGDAWVKFAANVKKNRGSSRQGTLNRWIGVLVLLLLLLAAGWAVWRILVKGHLKQAERPAGVVLGAPAAAMLFEVSKSAMLGVYPGRSALHFDVASDSRRI